MITCVVKAPPDFTPCAEPAVRVLLLATLPETARPAFCPEHFRSLLAQGFTEAHFVEVTG